MKKTVSLLLILLLSLTFPAFSEPSLSADGSHVLAVDQNGRVWAWGSNHMGESHPSSDEKRILTPVMIFENARAAFCGQQLSLILGEDGTLYAWGDNRENQISNEDVKTVREFTGICTDVASADACDSAFAAVTKCGQLYAWGGGSPKQLLSENAVKCAVGLNFILELDKDGNVFEHTADGKTLLLSDCTDIDASGESRYALKKDGTLYAWGANSADGRLALPAFYETVSAPEPIAAGNISAIRAGLSASGYLSEDRTLYVWGSVYSYLTAITDAGEVAAALMDGALITYGSTPLPLYDGVLDAAFGDAFVCILFENGDVYTWGSNDHGQLGNGTYTETVLYEEEEDGDYELSVLSASQGIFPSLPINLMN